MLLHRNQTPATQSKKMAQFRQRDREYNLARCAEATVENFVRRVSRHGRLFITMTALVVGGWPVAAQADAYVWGGRVGRLELHFRQLGFNEGAGRGGWQPGGAYAFAKWARILSAALPVGVGLEVIGEDGEPLKLLLKRCSSTESACEHPLSTIELQTGIHGSPEEPVTAAQLLGLVRKQLQVPLAVSNQKLDGPLYTIQVFSSPDEQKAATFAEQVDTRSLSVQRVMFYEACQPCRIGLTRVIAENRQGARRYKVIIGNFENEADARHALAAVSNAGLQGQVRILPNKLQ